MELMNEIERAPKSGDFAILLDAKSGAWEVGRWAQESRSWVQPNGKPLRLIPTHWAPASGDPSGSTWQGLSFLAPLRSLQKTVAKRPRTRSVLAFAALVMILIGGYAVFAPFAFIGTGSTGLELHRERERADVLVRDLAAAREKIALLIEREKSAQAQALEAKEIADAKQEELKKAFDEKMAIAERADALARDLAAAREKITVLIEREKSAQAKALEAKQIADAKQEELKKALDEKTATAEAFARELASIRANIASAGKHLNVDASAQDGASATGSLKHPIQRSNASPAITGTIPQPPKRPSQSQPAGTTAVAPNNATANNAEAQIAQTPSQPKCNVKACAAAYKSFNKSDCTFQPTLPVGAPRELCKK